jgi:adenine phosphoribosyltransferase
MSDPSEVAIGPEFADAQAAGHDIARLIGLIRDIPDYPQPGVLFRDITPLLADPAGFAESMSLLATPWNAEDVDVVVGVEARGFILAAPIALELGAGFVPVRKAGKLPGPTRAVAYELEYGQAVLEAHEDAFEPGARVLVVDDVLATGGTVAATIELVRAGGAEVVGVSMLMELTALGGRDRLPGVPVCALFRA